MKHFWDKLLNFRLLELWVPIYLYGLKLIGARREGEEFDDLWSDLVEVR